MSFFQDCIVQLGYTLQRISWGGFLNKNGFEMIGTGSTGKLCYMLFCVLSAQFSSPPEKIFQTLKLGAAALDP